MWFEHREKPIFLSNSIVGRIVRNLYAPRKDAKSQNPGRWSGNIRNWEPMGEVALNPEKVVMETQKAA